MRYEGWRIEGATVSGTGLTLTPTVVPSNVSFQVTTVRAVAADGKFVYIPYDVKVDCETNIGEHDTFAKGPTYVVLIVTPTLVPVGTADY